MEKAKEEVEVKKSVKEKPYIDSVNCAGCSLCVENCPKNCLKLSKPKFVGDTHLYAYLESKKDCASCGICAKVCPINAITMSKEGEFPTSLTKEKGGLKKTWYRLFQVGMKLANYFLGYRMSEYIEGPGCIKELPKKILEKGLKKILVVTDTVLFNLGIPKGFIDAAKEAGLDIVTFYDIQPNPTSDNVEAGFKVFREEKCDSIIAFGGGSSMDCAKAIAARDVHPNKKVPQLQGVLKVHKKICPFWAVPTTSGTGSETTVAAVITVSETRHKAAINDPSILPKYAVLDPELTMKLPPFVTATTGMDALCHAVESYTNWTYCTKLEKDLSKKTVKLIYDNLYEAFLHGDNLEARQNMQKAAFFAGRSFTRGCVGYVHAVGHTLGGLYGVAHGLAMSVILPLVLRQYGEKVYDKLADLADCIGLKGDNNKEKAQNFISWIDEMNEKMGIPKGLDVIKEEDKDQIIEWAMKEANPLYPVPVIWQKEDFLRLLHTIETNK